MYALANKKKIMNFLINALRGFFFFALILYYKMIDYNLTKACLLTSS